jgi:hypothetical protein
MIQQSSITPERALYAIQNVLSGHDAFGTANIQTRIPFPSALRRNHVRAAIILANIIEQLGAVYHPQHLTWLASKLLAHLAKTRQSYPLVGADYPIGVIANALKERPQLLGSKVGFAALVASGLAKHRCALSEAANKPVTPRRVLWEESPFSLTEMTHPCHLREDGLALRHCTGTRYDHDMLRSLERSPTPREALFALAYWQKIKSGTSRFFTLMEGETPRVTLQYGCMSKNITHLQARSPLTTGDRLLPPLCRALQHLRMTGDLVGVRGLPYSNHPRACLTMEGTYEILSEGNAHRIFSGFIAASTTITFSEPQFLCSVPNIRLNLEQVPVRLLKRVTRIEGTLVFGQQPVRLDRLAYVGGHVSVPRAPMVVMPSLVTIGGSNFCDHTKAIHQPQLVHIGGSNFCDYATLIHQPALRHIGRCNVLSPYAEICQPNLPATPSHPAPPTFLARP